MQHARTSRWIHARLALGGFGDVVGQFGQRFGGRNANARGQAKPPPHTFTQILGFGLHGLQRRLAAPLHKALVDGVHLVLLSHAFDERHHAIAHVAVQSKVGRKRHQTCFALEVAYLEPRRPHGNAQGLGLVAACNGATVIV